MPVYLPAPPKGAEKNAAGPRTRAPAAPKKHRIPRLPHLAFAPPALPDGAWQSAVLWQLAAALTGLVLGAGRVYGGAAPFGLGLVLGCGPTYMLACAAGAMVGGLLFQPPLTALQLAGALAAALAARRLGQDRYPLAAAAVSLVLTVEQLAAGLGLGSDLAQGAALAGTAALGVALGAAVRAWPVRTPRGACLWLAVLVACAQRLPLFGLAPGLALAALAGLCAAYAGTLEQSAVLILAVAAALTAASPALCYAALAVALGTLAAACLFPGERWRCAAVFSVGCGLGALAAPDLTALLPLAGGVVLGLLFYLLLPDRLLHTLFPTAAAAPAPQPAGLTATARRLTGVADALSDIAVTVNAVCERQLAPRGENFDFVVDYTARRLCQGCARRESCWLQGYSALVDGLYHLKAPLEARGRVEIEDMIGPLSGCIHPSDLCTAVTHGYRLWRSRRQTRAQTNRLRAALTEQYTAMASALAQLADRLGRSGLPDPRREARAAQLFAGIGLEALECSVSTDLAGRMTAAVTVARTAFAPEELAALTTELSRLCRRDFALPDVANCRTVTTLTFAERPLYRAVFGVANRAAAGQTVSGDAWEQFCDSAGRAQMLLCDGMGIGPAAAVDGQMAARLTAQLLRAGFAAESAARLVNVALGLKNSEQEAGATLDLLTVDLYTGRAGLFKAGAAPSFLVRGGVPRPLEGPSLPIGVLDTVVGRSTSLTLDEGDLLVMVSDGALSDGSDWLLQQLTLCARLGHSPEQLAKTVVESAVRRAGRRPDDVTAVVLRLEKAS